MYSLSDKLKVLHKTKDCVARDKAFVQRPDGKGSKHVQETPPGTEEQTWRAIAKQSPVPNLHIMKKVIVESNKDICDDKIHICF